jgi:DNA-binding SARP family transcriptional activator
MPPTSPSYTNSLRLFLFGAFRLEKAGQTIRLATRKAESLLAYLALHPTDHSRESLAATFWGDSPDEDARRSLRVALTNLRKQLGDDAFIASRDTLSVNPASPLWVDVLEFKAQAERVLAQNPPNPGVLNLELYQGPLLNAFFDEWVFPLRDSYQALYSEVLLKLIGHARSQSDYQRAIELAQRLLVSDPANELAHQHLMVCFAANGHRFAALKQYDECVRMLREHLAVEPSSETTALYKQ